MCIFCETGDSSRHIDHGLTDAEVVAAESCASLRGRLPVTVVTGFLGSGKTTLLNHVLAGAPGRRFCVVQNEFGAEPIDDALILRSATFAEASVLTLASGCVCCKVRDDLAAALKRLAVELAATSLTTSEASAEAETGSGGGGGGGGGAIEAVLIETSGLSEVAPVCVTLFADAFVQRHFRLDAVVALVDTQRAAAVVSGAGAAAAAAEAQAEAEAEAEAQEAGCVEAAAAEDEVDRDGGSDAGLGSDGSESEGEGASEAEGEEGSEDEGVGGAAARLLCEQLSLADIVLLNKQDLADVEEREAAAALAARLSPAAVLLPCERGQVPLDQLLDVRAFSVARCLQLDPSFRLDAAPPPPATPLSFATPLRSAASGTATSATAARAKASASAARPGAPAAHAHERFGSVALRRPQGASELDELDFTDWVEQVFRLHGRRLLRAKGLLFFRDIDTATSLQCVGSHVELERVPPQQMPPAELAARRSRLVFIGRTAGLEATLRDGFEAL